MNIFSQFILYPIPALYAAVILLLIFFLSRNPRLKALVIILNLVIALRYIFWRGFFTLNTFDVFAASVSLALFLAELYGFSQSVLFYYQSSKASDPVLPEGSDGFRPSVDILVTIYNEPQKVLFRTLVGCNALEYPKDKLNIYVLDDGGRQEIRDLAERLGCGYISRSTNEGAKAGNLNNALRRTHGEIVVVFDCDHIPVRSFLKETVGFFMERKVALVQAPHHFYNPDTFQRNLGLEREITNEQDLFFHIIQPGKDYHNSAFFCGSCGLFRRTALDETGGFLTSTVMEDLHTSMFLHARGYKSVYVNKDLSAGLAPESCGGYVKQRQRWATGATQIFMKDNPLFKSGLSFRQRMHYLSSITYFFDGVPRIIYLTAPLPYLLLGYSPIRTDIKTLLAYFLPYYISTIIGFNMIGRGFRNPFWSDTYETLMSFASTSAVLKVLFRPLGHKFSVTPKGERNESLRLETKVVIPHMLLLLLLLAGAVIGAYSLKAGTGDYNALLISLAWASYNTIILIVAIMAALEKPQRRGSIRLARDIGCELGLPDGNIKCRTRDLSETGLSIRLESDRPIAFTDPVISLSLVSDYGEVTLLKGRVMRNDRDRDGSIFVGIRFTGLDEEARQGVIRQMFSPEGTWSGYHKNLVSEKVWRFFTQALGAFFSIFNREKTLRRVSPRFPIRFDCELIFADGSLPGTIVDLSLTGALVEYSAGRKDFPWDLKLKIRTKDGSAIEAGAEVKREVLKKGKRFVGIRFSDPVEAKALWQGIANEMNSKGIVGVVV